MNTANDPQLPRSVWQNRCTTHRCTTHRCTTLRVVLPRRARLGESCNEKTSRDLLRTLAIALGLFALTPVAKAQSINLQSAAATPLSVATIELPLARPLVDDGPSTLTARDASGRVFYPVSENVRAPSPMAPPSQQPLPGIGGGRLLGRLGNLIREIGAGDAAEQPVLARRVHFLVAGSQPLTVELRDATGLIARYPITFPPDAAAAETLLSNWWALQSQTLKAAIDQTPFPPTAEIYQTAMLSGRLGLPLPAWYGGLTDAAPNDDVLLQTAALFTGGGNLDRSIFASAAAGTPPTAPTALPLPPPPIFNSSLNPSALDPSPPATLEPLAASIPADCFYLRYGSFENYLWFKDLSEEYGGDLASMVVTGALADNATARFEQQLGVKTNAMSRMLGPTVIEDQAIIGRDLLLGDGAAMGVVMRSRNAFLLRNSLTGDRQAAVSDQTGVTLQNVEIRGRQIPFLSTPDNRVRSFLVESGGTFLITNSRAIAESFLAVADGEAASLAQSPEFAIARGDIPVERNDSIFLYVSPGVIEKLFSPASMIELRRRIAARADIRLVRLARHAASAHGQPTSDIDRLIGEGFLPQPFGNRPDGSGTFAIGETLMDTARGRPGVFLPIPDAKIQSVTAEESAWYADFAARLTARLPTLSPIAVAVARQPPDAELPQDVPLTETLDITAQISPWDPSLLGKYADQLGPPTQVAMRFAPDDIAAVQAHVASDTLGPPTHLFAAIKDADLPQPEAFEGILSTYSAVRSLPGYLGAWPNPGTLDRLPLGLGRGTPVAPGLSRLLGGVYRYTGGGFSILSFNPDLMTAALPHLAAEQTPHEAQIRGYVKDLTGTRLHTWVNDQLFAIAATESQNGVSALNRLIGLLSLPPAEALDIATTLYAGRPRSPLGTDYQYDPAMGLWSDPALPQTIPPQTIPPQTILPGPTIPPPTYVHPLLTWFRGADFRMTQTPGRLWADAAITIQRK